MSMKQPRPIDTHWRLNHDEYEFMTRTAYEQGVSLAELARANIFKSGWKKRLEEMRRSHEASGLSHEKFVRHAEKNNKRALHV